MLAGIMWSCLLAGFKGSSDEPVAVPLMLPAPVPVLQLILNLISPTAERCWKTPFLLHCLE
jgi:hypothetical protein